MFFLFNINQSVSIIKTEIDLSLLLFGILFLALIGVKGITRILNNSSL